VNGILTYSTVNIMYCVNDMAFICSTVLDVRHTYFFKMFVKIAHTDPVQTVKVMYENVVVCHLL
jgi:hypothetical protein